jgi:hypothetical protein
MNKNWCFECKCEIPEHKWLCESCEEKRDKKANQIYYDSKQSGDFTGD